MICRRTVSDLLLLPLAALPLLVDWVYRVVIHPRPFWVYYYDAEGGYTYRGLHFLSPYAPRLMEHPGVPLQLISLLICKLLSVHSLLEIDVVRNTAYCVTLALALGGIFLLRRTLFRDTSAQMWIVGAWTVYLVPTVLTFSAVLTADILFLPAAAIVLAMLWRYDGSQRSLEKLGAAIGFAISVKVVFVAWLGGAAAMLWSDSRPRQERWRDILRVSLVTVATSICFIAPIGKRVLSFPGWFWMLLTTTSKNSTAPQAPFLVRTASDLAVALRPALGWCAFAAVIGIALSLVPLEVRERKRFVFLVASMVLSLILGARQPYPDFHYVSPMAFASIGLVALFAERFSTKYHVAALAAVVALGFASVYQDIRDHDAAIAEQTTLRTTVEKAVHALAPHGVVIYSWHLPEPSLALKAITTDPNEFRAIARVYPNEGHWAPWRDRLFLPPGARRWDIAVIQDDFLPRFPDPIGPTLMHLPDDYTIVARRMPGAKSP